MKARKVHHLGLSAVSLTAACEKAFEKCVNYRYRIQNNTSTAVLVTVEVMQHLVAITKEDGAFYYSIGLVSAKVIYNCSCFAAKMVWDKEKRDATLHWFAVAAFKNG